VRRGVDPVGEIPQFVVGVLGEVGQEVDLAFHRGCGQGLEGPHVTLEHGAVGHGGLEHHVLEQHLLRHGFRERDGRGFDEAQDGLGVAADLAAEAAQDLLQGVEEVALVVGEVGEVGAAGLGDGVEAGFVGFRLEAEPDDEGVHLVPAAQRVGGVDRRVDAGAGVAAVGEEHDRVVAAVEILVGQRCQAGLALVRRPVFMGAGRQIKVVAGLVRVVQIPVEQVAGDRLERIADGRGAAGR